MIFRLPLLALPLVIVSVAIADHEADRATLLDGVHSIAAPGWPGCLAVYGDDAFAVVVGGAQGKNRAPVVAAGSLDKGRIVAFGHNGYFSAMDTADTGKLFVNSVRW